MSEIAAEFVKYKIACYGDPPVLHPVQAKEVRQAFFGGALSSLLLVMKICNAPNYEEAAQALEALHEEIRVLGKP